MAAKLWYTDITAWKMVHKGLKKRIACCVAFPSYIYQFCHLRSKKQFDFSAEMQSTSAFQREAFQSALQQLWTEAGIRCQDLELLSLIGTQLPHNQCLKTLTEFERIIASCRKLTIIVKKHDYSTKINCREQWTPSLASFTVHSYTCFLLCFDRIQYIEDKKSASKAKF